MNFDAFYWFPTKHDFLSVRILYKMSKRYKRKSLNSSLFHHGLIKIFLIHHLKTVGNCWEGFLMRNGFIMDFPVEISNSEEPLIKNSLTSQLMNQALLTKTL
jgi:hypothetical protein